MKALPLLLLFLPMVFPLKCIQYSYHPVDGSYDEVPTLCPNYCVKYAVKMYVRQTSKMTFFLGNCDDGHFCPDAATGGFNRTLTRRAYENVFGTSLPPTVSKIQIMGNCCTRDNCNRF